MGDDDLSSDYGLMRGKGKELGSTSYLSTFSGVLVMRLVESFRFVIYAFDVIHSFGILGFGFKFDAIPGRFHFGNLIRSFFPGSFVGFCYELCGRAHSIMLISCRVV